jgi:hypothetical protein
MGGLREVLCNISELLAYVIPVLIALGVVYFVFGVVTYVIGDSDEAKKKGRDKIIYGVIGLAVITALWGLVNIVTDTFIILEDAPTNNQLRGLLPR